MSFNPGDVVVLKSGSNPMTVEEILHNGKVLCVWYLEGRYENYTFAPEALKLRG